MQEDLPPAIDPVTKSLRIACKPRSRLGRSGRIMHNFSKEKYVNSIARVFTLQLADIDGPFLVLYVRFEGACGDIFSTTTCTTTAATFTSSAEYTSSKPAIARHNKQLIASASCSSISASPTWRPQPHPCHKKSRDRKPRINLEPTHPRFRVGLREFRVLHLVTLGLWGLEFEGISTIQGWGPRKIESECGGCTEDHMTRILQSAMWQKGQASTPKAHRP